jgi:predicted phosphate transport protein (TIGR00153 family)
MSITKASIFNIFGRSPISALQEHMQRANACVEALVPFFTAVLAKDWSRVEQLHLHVSQLEHAADEIKTDLRLHLPKSIFLSLPRSDILELLTVQDAVANQAKYIANLIFSRRMEIPVSLEQQFRALLHRSVEASAQAAQAIAELDALLDSGFQGSEVRLVESMIHELGAIEQDTDQMQIKIQRKIFELEKLLPPLEVIFLYKVASGIAHLADRAQHVGEHLHLLLAQ